MSCSVPAGSWPLPRSGGPCVSPDPGVRTATWEAVHRRGRVGVWWRPRRWWRSAARAADESGDWRAASLARGRQAVFSLYGGRAAASTLSLAGEAIAAGQGKPCAGVVSGYAARAQALAQLGRREDAQTALEALQDVFGGLPGEVSADHRSQWGWSEIRLRHVESYVHTPAGDIRAAARAPDAALALYPATAYQGYQGRTQIPMHRATCLIRAC